MEYIDLPSVQRMTKEDLPEEERSDEPDFDERY